MVGIPSIHPVVAHIFPPSAKVTKLAYLLSQGLSAVECRKAPMRPAGFRRWLLESSWGGDGGCFLVEQNVSVMDYYDELVEWMVNYDMKPWFLFKLMPWI